MGTGLMDSLIPAIHHSCHICNIYMNTCSIWWVLSHQRNQSKIQFRFILKQQLTKSKFNQVDWPISHWILSGQVFNDKVPLFLDLYNLYNIQKECQTRLNRMKCKNNLFDASKLQTKRNIVQKIWFAQFALWWMKMGFIA